MFEPIIIKLDYSPRDERHSKQIKSVASRLGKRIGRGLAGRPNIGKNRRTIGSGRIDIPTGGVRGYKRPTGNRRDIDRDGWADEGTTNPVWVGLSGGRDRPIIETQRARPKINLNNQKINERKKIRQKIKYGESSLDGKLISKKNGPKWLNGLSNEQISNILVPDSYQTYSQMLADGFGVDKETIEKYLESRWGVGKPWLEIDYSESSTKQLKQALKTALDESPIFSWAVRNYGSPTYTVMTRKSAETYNNRDAVRPLYDALKKMYPDAPGEPQFAASNHLDFEMVTFNPINVIDKKSWQTNEPISSSFQTSKLPSSSDTVIDRSISGTILHEWAHWYHSEMLLANIESSENKKRSPKSLVNPQDSDFAEKIKIALEYNSDNGNMNLHSTKKPLEDSQNEPRTITSYGHVSRKEMFAEGMLAYMHPNEQLKLKAINKKLRQDIETILAGDKGVDAWKDSKANIRREKNILSSGRKNRKLTKLSSGSKTEEPERPTYPRHPSYGPFLDGADDVFADVKNWKEFKEIYDNLEINFFDYETTGLVSDEFRQSSGNGAPVQFGVTKTKGGKEIGRLNIFMNPGEELGDWSKKNLKNKDGEPLTDEWLSSQISIADAHKKLIEFVGPDAIFGVQNAVFDKTVLEDALTSSGIEWRPKGWVDTKVVSDLVIPKWTKENQDAPWTTDGKTGEKIPSSSLKALTEYLNIDLGKKHHTADADAAATSELMSKIIDKAIEKNWSNDIFDKNWRDQKIKDKLENYQQKIIDFEQQKSNWISETSPKKSTVPKEVEKKEFGFGRLSSGTTSYKGRHESPDASSGAPLHNLANGAIYPEDIYGPNGANLYGGAFPDLAQKAVAIFRKLRNKPDSELTIYRAVPRGKNIKEGDWVTILPEYAKIHGDSWLKDNYEIVTKKVKAKELFNEGNSLLEFGYHSKLSSGKYDGAPTYKGKVWKDRKNELDGPVWPFRSQAKQYPDDGPSGISYFKGVVDDSTWVDCLLYRDDSGKVIGILNHYPFALVDPDDPRIVERRGNINIFIDPKHQGKGIATKLVDEAVSRYNVDLRRQRYSEDGANFINRYIRKLPENRDKSKLSSGSQPRINLSDEEKREIIAIASQRTDDFSKSVVEQFRRNGKLSDRQWNALNKATLRRSRLSSGMNTPELSEMSKQRLQRRIDSYEAAVKKGDGSESKLPWDKNGKIKEKPIIVSEVDDDYDDDEEMSAEEKENQAAYRETSNISPAEMARRIEREKASKERLSSPEYLEESRLRRVARNKGKETSTHNADGTLKTENKPKLSSGKTNRANRRANNSRLSSGKNTDTEPQFLPIENLTAARDSNTDTNLQTPAKRRVYVKSKIPKVGRFKEADYPLNVQLSIVEDYKDKRKTLSYIAKKHNVSISVVQFLARQYNLPYRVNNPKSPRRQRIIEAIRNDMPFEEIMEKFNTSREEVIKLKNISESAKARKLRLTREKIRRQKKEEKIIQLFNDGLRITEVARLTKMDISAVADVLLANEGTKPKLIARRDGSQPYRSILIPQVRELFKNGLNIAQIGKTLKKDIKIIRKIVNEDEELSKLQRERIKKRFLLAQISEELREFFINGGSMEGAIEKFGLSRKQIKQWRERQAAQSQKQPGIPRLPRLQRGLENGTLKTENKPKLSSGKTNRANRRANNSRLSSGQSPVFDDQEKKQILDTLEKEFPGGITNTIAKIADYSGSRFQNNKNDQVELSPEEKKAVKALEDLGKIIDQKISKLINERKTTEGSKESQEIRLLSEKEKTYQKVASYFNAIQKVIDSKYEDVAKIDKQVRKSIVSNIYKIPKKTSNIDMEYMMNSNKISGSHLVQLIKDVRKNLTAGELLKIDDAWDGFFDGQPVVNFSDSTRYYIKSWKDRLYLTDLVSEADMAFLELKENKAITHDIMRTLNLADQILKSLIQQTQREERKISELSDAEVLDFIEREIYQNGEAFGPKLGSKKYRRNILTGQAFTSGEDSPNPLPELNEPPLVAVFNEKSAKDLLIKTIREALVDEDVNQVFNKSLKAREDIGVDYDEKLGEGVNSQYLLPQNLPFIEFLKLYNEKRSIFQRETFELLKETQSLTERGSLPELTKYGLQDFLERQEAELKRELFVQALGELGVRFTQPENVKKTVVRLYMQRLNDFYLWAKNLNPNEDFGKYNPYEYIGGEKGQRHATTIPLMNKVLSLIPENLTNGSLIVELPPKEAERLANLGAAETFGYLGRQRAISKYFSDAWNKNPLEKGGHKLGIIWRLVPGKNRAHAHNVLNGKVLITQEPAPVDGPTDDWESVALHEISHGVEYANPVVTALEWMYWASRRKANEQIVTLRHKNGKKYRDKSEVGIVDEWGNSYAGKIYQGRPFDALEIFTTGMQAIFYENTSKNADPSHRAFTIGVLIATGLADKGGSNG